MTEKLGPLPRGRGKPYSSGAGRARTQELTPGLASNVPHEVLRLGLKCNARCLFCNVPPDNLGPDEDFARAARAGCRAAGRGGCVSVSGGEPTLYPELARLIAYARRKGVKAELQTNGIALARRGAVEELARAGLAYAFVSLHSHIPAIHDFLTGIRGSQEACVKAVRNFVACGVHTTLNPVITTANCRGLADYVRFAGRRLGVKFISLSVVQPRGLALKNRALVPDYRALNVPVRAALKAALEEGVTVLNPICGLPLCVGDWYKYPERCVEYSLGKLGLPFTCPKVKAPACRKCAASAYCAGVWAEYPRIRGFGALKPLAKSVFSAGAARPPRGGRV